MVFHIVIGDWSRDGHSMSKTFLIESNKPLDAVREAFFAAQAKLPRTVHPDKFMDQYEDQSLPEKTYRDALALGYDFLKGFKDSDVSFREQLEYPQVDPEALAAYTVWFIRQGDPTLELALLKVEKFHFAGYDEKKRHIDQIGYGLFVR